jgi:hypothetical protein
MVSARRQRVALAVVLGVLGGLVTLAVGVCATLIDVVAAGVSGLDQEHSATGYYVAFAVIVVATVATEAAVVVATVRAVRRARAPGPSR